MNCKLWFNELHRIKSDGILEDPSAVLVVDDLQRYFVKRRCCKRQSGLRNWSVCKPLLPPHTRIWTLCRLSYLEYLFPYKRSSSRVTNSSHLRHTSCLTRCFNDCQRQSLQPTAGVSSNILDRFRAMVSARREHRKSSWTWSWSSSWGFFTKPLCLIFALHKAYQVYFDFTTSFSDLFWFYKKLLSFVLISHKASQL